MSVSSCTTEGWPSVCPTCGKQVWIEPSHPTGDATCPHCGGLLWMTEAPSVSIDILARLADLGAEVETDDQGQVRLIRFTGKQYDDSTVEMLAKLSGIDVLDVSETSLTTAGIRQLQELLPATKVIS